MEGLRLERETTLNPILAKTNIPCLFLPSHSGCNKIIIYFHANAEDIGLAYPLLESLRTSSRFNVLAPEYPGYGTYRRSVARTPEEKS